MHKLCFFGLIFFSTIVSLGIIQTSHATGLGVVISQIKVGNSSSSRLIEIYNNSNSSIDITNWCLFYSSPSNAAPYTNLGCFSDSNPFVHIFINPQSFALLASIQTGLSADIVLTAGLGSGTSGHVYLNDSIGNEIDKVGWGEAVNSNVRPAVLGPTKVIERKRDAASNTLIDTNNNEADFMASILRTDYQYGKIYEITDVCANIVGIQETTPIDYTVDINGNCNPPPIDVCSNLEGLQTIVPSGYLLDASGECQADVCLNIDGLQQTLPINMELDSSGNCVLHDECSNLLGIQVIIGDGYKRGNNHECVLDLLPIKITELLANPIDSDDGNEFIEIHNPNNNRVYLTDYIFYIGASTTKYSFPIDSYIERGQYLAFYNDNIKFTLVNTTSSVKLKSADNQSIDEVSAYSSPDEDMAWVLIDGLWQYTNRPTPGSANVSSLVLPDNEILTVNNMMPCAANQYRSLETNRCRLLVLSTSTLAACKDGQYRSEETNRCRNIATDVSQLMPCAEGQERNPATNRCRSTSAVLGASELTPCKAGQERNPETNRCRNVVGTIPTAGYAPEQANESSNNSILMWSLISVGAIAIFYGIWEWRQEIIGLVKKIRMNIGGKV